jgi:hypothetical protein
MGPENGHPNDVRFQSFLIHQQTLFYSGVPISESPNPGVRTMVQRTLITDIITVYGSFLHTIFPNLFE